MYSPDDRHDIAVCPLLSFQLSKVHLYTCLQISVKALVHFDSGPFNIRPKFKDYFNISYGAFCV